jgi:prepilin-type N-terminal cleavage/methylation domain-containing protein
MDDIKRRRHSERGYSLVEMMLVVGVIGVVTALAVVQMGPARDNARGDAAMRVVTAQLNQAREQAIGQRRYIRVTFDTTKNQVSMVREDTTATTTTLSIVGFEGGATFTLVSGLPDTPDAFGKATSTAFTSSNGAFASLSGSTSVVKFSPDGTLVDWNGRVANGTVFMALSNIKTSARAVTVLGSTGRVRAYRWDGSAWKVV